MYTKHLRTRARSTGTSWSWGHRVTGGCKLPAEGAGNPTLKEQYTFLTDEPLLQPLKEMP